MNGAAPASSPVRKTGEETLDFGVAAVDGKSRRQVQQADPMVRHGSVQISAKLIESAVIAGDNIIPERIN